MTKPVLIQLGRSRILVKGFRKNVSRGFDCYVFQQTWHFFRQDLHVYSDFLGFRVARSNHVYHPRICYSGGIFVPLWSFICGKLKCCINIPNNSFLAIALERKWVHMEKDKKIQIPVGFEPTTAGRDHRCSANWATKPPWPDPIRSWVQIPLGSEIFSLSPCRPISF